MSNLTIREELEIIIDSYLPNRVSECINLVNCILNDWAQEAIRHNGYLQLNGRAHSIYFTDEYIKERLDWALNEFDKILEQKQQPKKTGAAGDNIKVKLNWTGSQKQMLDILRQLMNMGLLDNTNKEVGEFLHYYVNGFEGSQPSTIEKAFPKISKDPPMSTKRIIIDCSDKES